MYYIVFQVVMGGRIPNFPVYVFSGLMLWMFFTDCTTRSIVILKRQRSLYEHTTMDKIEIYIAQHISASIGLFFNILIFLVSALFSGVYPSYHYLYIILIYLNLLLLSLGVSLILSNLFVLIPDVQNIWGIVVMFGFFLSPILFRGEVFQEKVPILVYLNPISGIINNARNILLYAKHPEWDMVIFNFGYALIIFIVGVFMYRSIAKYASELV
jgi:ABC-type polysaccharide/polyol phosphate export permease